MAQICIHSCSWKGGGAVAPYRALPWLYRPLSAVTGRPVHVIQSYTTDLCTIILTGHTQHKSREGGKVFQPLLGRGSWMRQNTLYQRSPGLACTCFEMRFIRAEKVPQSTGAACDCAPSLLAEQTKYCWIRGKAPPRLPEKEEGKRVTPWLL